MNNQDNLLNLLVENKIINLAQLAEVKQAATVVNGTIESVLLERGFINQEELMDLKAKVYNLPYRNLVGEKINEQYLNSIPQEVSQNYKIVCFNKDADKIYVGILDPNNFKAVEAVDFLAKGAGLRAEYYLISEASYEAVFKQYENLTKEVDSALKEKTIEDEQERDEAKKEVKIEFQEITKSAPVVKIVSVIIRHAIDGRASDIHIEPLQKETRVRYRIDGVLQTSLLLPKNVHNSIVARIKVMSKLKLDETRIPQDGRIRLNIEDKEIDLRVSILPLMEEEKVVMRILDLTKGAPTLEELGYTGIGLKVIKNNIKKSDGMLLVTGPTGSGKSTTLFSVMNILNKENVNISTLEDPIEYFIKGANQSQVKPEIGYTFATGLRSLLRQDPDIIMVGEIRDSETAELAIHAGLTGHFVLSTLHTNSALGAVPRLIDMKVEPFLLGSTINTIIAQRLARRICVHCKQETKVPEDIMIFIKEVASKIAPSILKEMIKNFDKNNIILYKGAGCPRCGGLGYGGRVALNEVIDVNDKIKEIIMNKNSRLKLEDILASQKFITMAQDGVLKILQGITTAEEVLRVVHN